MARARRPARRSPRGLGLQSGDVIRAINGLPMTSPDRALQIYTKLAAANHLTVALERHGRKVTLDYDIR